MTGEPDRRSRPDADRLRDLVGREIARVSRAGAVALALIGVTLAVQVGFQPHLDLGRLRRSMSDFVERMPAAFDTLYVVGAMAFILGAALGWLGALAWLSRRWRRRSLLLVASHEPDITFADAVLHVRGRSAAAGIDDAEATRLLVEAASHGHVSLWRPATSNMLRRVTARQLRRIAADVLRRQERGVPGAWPVDIELHLLRHEIERLWPRHAPIEITQRVVTLQVRQPVTREG